MHTSSPGLDAATYVLNLNVFSFIQRVLMFVEQNQRAYHCVGAVPIEGGGEPDVSRVDRANHHW